jgi:hypothetical protein
LRLATHRSRIRAFSRIITLQTPLILSVGPGIHYAAIEIVKNLDLVFEHFLECIAASLRTSVMRKGYSKLMSKMTTSALCHE